MKSLKIITLCMLGMASSHALASVELVIDDGLDLLAVSGEEATSQKTEGGLFSSKTITTLPDGENQIVFRYSYSFGRGDSYESIDSQVIVAKFTAHDSKLNFKFPEYKNARAAKKGVKGEDFSWALVDEKTQQAIDIKEDKLIHYGMQLGRDYQAELTEYNRKGGPAAITLLTTTSKPVTSSADNSSVSAEEMLHFWYQKADAETKARFKAYINQ